MIQFGLGDNVVGKHRGWVFNEWATPTLEPEPNYRRSIPNFRPGREWPIAKEWHYEKIGEDAPGAGDAEKEQWTTSGPVEKDGKRKGWPSKLISGKSHQFGGGQGWANASGLEFEKQPHLGQKEREARSNDREMPRCGCRRETGNVIIGKRTTRVHSQNM